VLLAYWLTAFLSGAGVLVVEMMAPRALAPWFGQAQFVWSNVIGLVLAGLALGNMLGGRLADRRQSPTLLGGLLCIGAALVVAAAFLVGPVSRGLLPDALPLEVAYPFLRRGSFVATAVCFLPPVLLLGAVAPFLVRCATTRVEELGRTSGLLYGAATLGSIAGSFATEDLLYERLGTRGSMVAAAGLIALSAVPLFWSARSRGSAGLATVLGASMLCGTRSGVVSAAPFGAAAGEPLVAIDSRYQHLEVRRRDDLGSGSLVLAIDEGHDSFQSITPAEGVLTGGLYYDYVNLLALDSIREGRLRVAILGLAAGTHARQLLALVGPRCELRIDGVEIDAGAVSLGRSHLGLPDDPRLRLLTDLDARTFVDHSPDEYELILVDCYARQSFVPPHVASVEFFAAAHRRLRPGGTVALNAFGYGADDPVTASVVATLGAAFPEGVVVASLPNTANQLVWATRGEPPRGPDQFASDAWPESMKSLAARLGSPGQWFRATLRTTMPALHDGDGWFDALQQQRLEARAKALLAGAGGSR
jgi:spermidine synthase